MDAVQAPVVPIVGDLIRAVPGTISLGQGVVHYGPPREASDALQAMLASGAATVHDYQAGTGLPELVDLIHAKLEAENQVTVGRESRIAVTAGANMAFMHAVLATTRPGDEVILPVPFYFNHEMAVEMAGCRPVPVPTDDRYQPRIDAISRAMTDRTRMVVTVSPNNPTGAVFAESILRDINALCRDRRVYHVSDEAYEYFVYGRSPHVSPASFAGAAAHTISIYSLSKAYGFAGWRIGYMVYPEHLADGIAKSQDTILICPPVASQIAAIAAMRVGRAHCEPHVRELAVVRQLVLAELSKLAPLVEVPAADGALYCMLKVRTTMDPMTITERLIREHRVAVIPGPAFGMVDGCYFRVAYGALQRATVEEGIGRLIRGLKEIAGARL
jgi:aspartate/methionine/tyrosine aminotransferase